MKTLLHCQWKCKLIDTMENSMEILHKSRIKPTCDPAIPILGMYAEKTTIAKETCTPMFISKFSQSVQSLSGIRLFATAWTAAHQASLFITNSQSLLKLMSTEFMMRSNYLIFCHPLLLLTPIFSSIRVFSNESVLYIRCPNCPSFRFSASN